MFALTIADADKELGAWLFNDWLQGKLQDGTYKISPEVQVMGHGLKVIQDTMDVLRKGVSAKKLVVTLA